jgi:hypothetical protein
MDEKEKSSRTIFDEMFVGAVLLFLSSIICGKLISAPLGNILLVGCAVYVFAFLFMGFPYLVISTFRRIDEERKNEVAESQPESEDSKGYFMYFAAIYIVFWILMFIIFPENSDVGEFIRQWKHY